MKRFTYIIAVFIAVSIMAGCRHTPQTEALEQIEALLPAEPDSADVQLSMVDPSCLNDDEFPLYALLRTATDILQGLDAPATDSLIRPAYDYYSALSRQGTSSDLIAVRRFGQAAQHLGEWYEAQDSIKACEDCFRQAIRASEKAEDWHTCYISYQRLADPVHYANDEEALTLLEKSIEIYHKVNDSPRNLLSLLLLAANVASNIAYINDTDFTPALDYANKAYRMAVDSGWTDFQNQGLAILALIHWSKGDYPEALRYGKTIPIPDLETEAGIETNMRVAQYYLSCDSFAKAKEMYQSVRKIDDLTNKYLYARALTEIAIHQQEKDTALLYLDSAFTCSERMYFDALKVKDDYYQQTITHEKTQEALRDQARRRTLIGLSVAALLTALILFLWQRRRYERKRHLLTAQHLSRENELLNHKRELLQDSVKKKEGMIRFLQGYIIERMDVAKKLQTETDANVTLSRKDWIDIERVLNEIDDNSIAHVRAAYPHLSQDDLHLCMLVRLRMSNPVIGRIYSITPSAVQHRKQKLKKEGFGVSDPSKPLEDVIVGV